MKFKVALHEEPVCANITACVQRQYSSSTSSGNGGDETTEDKNKPKTPATPAKGGTDKGKGGKKGSNQLCCPKCGDPCTHVETFVCK